MADDKHQADEAIIQATLDGRRTMADMQEKAGNITKAQELRARLPQDEIDLRAQQGVPAPTKPVEAAAGHVANPDPKGYAAPDLSAVQGLPVEAKAGIASDLAALNSANGYDAQFGNIVSSIIVGIGAEQRGMKSDALVNWVAGQQALALKMAGGKELADKWFSAAERALSKTEFGRTVIKTGGIYSVRLQRTLYNLAQAAEAFKK